MDPVRIRDPEDRIRYTFNDKGLLIRALTHSRFRMRKPGKKGQKIAHIREPLPLSVMQCKSEVCFAPHKKKE